MYIQEDNGNPTLADTTERVDSLSSDIELHSDSINSLLNRISHLEYVVRNHEHKGHDYTQKLSPTSTIYVDWRWNYTDAANSNNYLGVIWVAPSSCIVTGITEEHYNNSTSGHLTVYKNGSTSLLTGDIDVSINSGLANTGILTSTKTSLIFAKNDSINVGLTGTLTNLQSLFIQVKLTLN